MMKQATERHPDSAGQGKDSRFQRIRRWLPAGALLLLVAAGFGFAVLSFHVSIAAFLWLAPIAAALMLAPVVAWASGLPDFGQKLWHWNVFRIPEEAAQAPTPEEIIGEPLLEAAE